MRERFTSRVCPFSPVFPIGKVRPNTLVQRKLRQAVPPGFREGRHGVWIRRHRSLRGRLWPQSDGGNLTVSVRRKSRAELTGVAHGRSPVGGISRTNIPRAGTKESPSCCHRPVRPDRGQRYRRKSPGRVRIPIVYGGVRPDKTVRRYEGDSPHKSPVRSHRTLRSLAFTCGLARSSMIIAPVGHFNRYHMDCDLPSESRNFFALSISDSLFAGLLPVVWNTKPPARPMEVSF